MKLYEKIENNKFDEIDEDRAIELIKNGNGHLVFNSDYFRLKKENVDLKTYAKMGNIIVKESILKIKIEDKINGLADLANKINNEIVEELKSNDICQEYLEDKRKELRLINRDIKTLQSLLEESEDSKDGEG